MSRRLVALVVAIVASGASWAADVASAQTVDRDAETKLVSSGASLIPTVSEAWHVAPLPIFAVPAMPAPRPTRSSSSGLLKALYASTASMQALDVQSTLAGFRRGASEGNPILAGAASHPAAFIAVKAGIATATIFAARSMARHNRVAAIATLIGVNSLYAAVISHNYRVLHGGR